MAEILLQSVAKIGMQTKKGGGITYVKPFYSLLHQDLFLPLVNLLFKGAESVPAGSKGEVMLLKCSMIQGSLI